MVEDFGGLLSCYHSAGEGFGDVQRSGVVEFEDVEVWVLATLTASHDHIGLLCLEERDGPVEVFLQA